MRSLGSQRTPMALTLAFASIAVTLAVIGIYGVLSWSVTQRFGEIGVRMALGARGDDIVGMILKQGGRLIVLGLVLGFGAALALGRAMASQIYEVSATDPAVFAIALVTLSVLLLSAAGMYALMSFTVNQRRREIGIRAALGAQPARLLAGTFRRPLAQLAGGAAAGLLAAYLLGGLIPIEDLGGREVPGVLAAAAIFMAVVGLLAVAGPARRALRMAPTEALRDGG